MMQSCTLLRDGRAAFDETLRCCDAAQSSILVNMFIWRDDEIGNALARALLRAAERGVRVTISKDRCGGIFERAEETGQSFFHKAADVKSALAAAGLRYTIPKKNRAGFCRQRKNPIADTLARHPRVQLDARRFKYDHTKYYVIDEALLFLGGINVEDKEVSADITGMAYHDFMIKISSPEEVAYFYKRLHEGAPFAPSRAERGGMEYLLNGMHGGKRTFGVLEGYLRLIDGAQSAIDIMMPYIGEKRINAALLLAAARGVSVRLLLPRNANLQQNFNMRTADLLLQKSANIRLFLTPLMCHAKMMLVDGKIVTIGSANMNRNGIAKCLELNCVSRDAALVRAAAADFQQTLAGASLCAQPAYSRLAGWLEGLFLS